MSTDTLLAKLGPKVARIPAGEKRVSKGLMTAKKTARKVRVAMSLATIGGVEAMTRVHGSQTQSMDYDALTPQDVAAALGFNGTKQCFAKRLHKTPDSTLLELAAPIRVVNKPKPRDNSEVLAAIAALDARKRDAK